MRIRSRRDNRMIAAMKAAGESSNNQFDQSAWDVTPPARPGDVWRVGGGTVQAYAIACECGKVHLCSLADPEHTWTGSPEAGTLSVTPALETECGREISLLHGEIRVKVVKVVPFDAPVPEPPILPE